MSATDGDTSWLGLESDMPPRRVARSPVAAMKERTTSKSRHKFDSHADKHRG